MPSVSEIAALAESSGFTHAAKLARETALRASNMAQAYEHYRFVNQLQIDKFNARLKEQTLKRTGTPGVNLHDHYDVLAFTPIEKYPSLPPANVLTKVTEAKARGIFDTFEVAQVSSVVEYKDPIVFGRITGCGDRFFVAQWDSDVRIEDLIGPHEG